MFCTPQFVARDPRWKMRLGSIILFVAFCSFTAYYVYEPIPEEIEERWKLMLTNSFFRSLSHLVRGIKKKRTILAAYLDNPLCCY